MKFRLGLMIGFGAGYYLGARAGRERYEQMQAWLERARQSPAYEKAQATLELGVERARQQLEPLLANDTNEPGSSRLRSA